MHLSDTNPYQSPCGELSQAAPCPPTLPGFAVRLLVKVAALQAAASVAAVAVAVVQSWETGWAALGLATLLLPSIFGYVL